MAAYDYMLGVYAICAAKQVAAVSAYETARMKLDEANKNATQ